MPFLNWPAAFALFVFVLVRWQFDVRYVSLLDDPVIVKRYPCVLGYPFVVRVTGKHDVRIVDVGQLPSPLNHVLGDWPAAAVAVNPPDVY